MNKKQIYKKLKKNKKKIILFYLTCFMIIISTMAVPPVRAETSYSSYLENQPITIDVDSAKIKVETASAGNNYKNLFETGFLFPYKLHYNMFSTEITSTPSKYLVNQYYLDNLDSEYSFANYESNEQYETETYVENYTDLNVNSGSYNNNLNLTNEVHFSTDSDVITEWLFDSTPHYNKLNDDNPNTLIRAYDGDELKIEKFTFNDTIQYFETIESISLEIKFYSSLPINITSNVFEQLYINTGIYYPSEYQSYSLTLKNNDFSTQELNNMFIIFEAYNSFTMFDYSAIYDFYIKVNFVKSNNVLEKIDNYVYNYNTDVTGVNGLFPSEYSFTSDSDGSNPIGWTISETGGTINVISTIDNHNKIVEFDDTSSSNHVNMYNSFSGKTTGTIEYWIRLENVNDNLWFRIQDGGFSHELIVYFRGNGYYGYYDAGYHDQNTYTSDTWYHVRIEFDCSTNWHLWINDVSIDGGSGFTYVGTPTSMDTVYINTDNLDIGKGYIDAIDYSWSDDYFINRNMYDSFYDLNMTSNLQVEYSSSYDNLENLTFEYVFTTNISSLDLSLYLFSFISNQYDLIDIVSINTDSNYNYYNFDLNYTYYSRTGNVNFKFVTTNSDSYYVNIDKIGLNALFSNYTLNDSGFHEINNIYLREKSDTTHLGNMSLNLKLYKEYFILTHNEINVGSNGFEYQEIVNFGSYINEINEIEIQTHVRYGLNTLDVKITNVYYLITINYNYTYEYFTQVYYGNQLGNYYTNKFDYTCNNFNRLNLTGIYGNYSYNCLNGVRVLRSNIDDDFNRYFLIPFFDEKISLTSGVPFGSTDIDIDEPTLPSSVYWSYETFRIVDSNFISIDVGNFSTEFQSIKTEKYTAKYPYVEKLVKRSSFGNWKIKITDDFKVNLNIIRNAIADIINLLSILTQRFIFFGATAVNYIFMFIVLNIIVLIWNYPIYWLNILWLTISWFIIELLVSIWYGIIWIWKELFIPLVQWFWNVAFPVIVDFFITILAHMITFFIYIATLGNADYIDTYFLVYDVLWIIADAIIELVRIFTKYIVLFMLAVLHYIALLLLIYFRMLYRKSKGNVEGANELRAVLDVLAYPVLFVIDLIKTILGITPEI